MQCATAVPAGPEREHAVSTHAPAQGATTVLARLGDMLRVSTHAPAQGATHHPALHRGRDPRFNPRARTGRDAPRRARPPPPAGFNPRARTGRDRCNGLHPQITVIVSTHAPAQGATRADRQAVRRGSGFNPRARTGRDRGPHLHPERMGRFNPRARTGRDADRAGSVPRTHRFNPRARTGRDSRASPPPCLTPCFNPRARTGRDAFCVMAAYRTRDVSTHAPA